MKPLTKTVAIRKGGLGAQITGDDRAPKNSPRNSPANRRNPVDDPTPVRAPRSTGASEPKLKLDTKPKKGGDANSGAVRSRAPAPRPPANDTPPEVSPSPASGALTEADAGKTLVFSSGPSTTIIIPAGVCPTCGQRIRPKVDRKDYMARYMRDWRARKRAEKA